MSRFRRVVHSAASGYVVLVVTAVYALASVPLALHYLSKKEFALWALMGSISGYLSLIDVGMSSSVARLLIDHKDQREGGTYGGLIKTGWLVLVAQGTIVLLVGTGLAPLLADLLAIQPALRPQFIEVLRWQSASLALGFVLRIFSHLLHAHQRVDIINYSQIAMVGLNFLLLWWFFHLGQGVFSLVWSALLSSLCIGGLWWAACWRLKLFPEAGRWGRASWHCFKEIFDYGKDMFLVAVGGQLVLASQTMIVTRRLGEEAATDWNIGTRAFNLLCQAVWRIFDFSVPAFSEMIVRGERALLRERYQAVVVVTASVSGVAAIIFALCNSLFVSVWTQGNGRVYWPPGNDLLLGAWMVVLAGVHCHNGLTLLTKRVGFTRYIYFVEGIVFVSAALLVVQRGGMPALILCSVICSTLFSGAYGVWRASRYFDLPLKEVGLRWLFPMARVMVLVVPVALAGWWLVKSVGSASVRLAVHALLGGSLGGYLLLRFGLPRPFQQELVRRAPRPINVLLRRVFPGATT